MIDWILISLLILGGIGLIIIEIIFVPGTTIVGIFGFVIGIFGIYRSYELFGAETGHIVLVVSALIGAIATIYSFKSNAWKRFALDDKITATVNKNMVAELNVQDEGVTTSSLKPMGKAEFLEKEFEVTTLGQFVEEKTNVRIIKIERNKIIVEPII